MNTKITIKLKAALLLTVFSLNTVICFACSTGVDMGFNGKHHHGEESEVAVQSPDHEMHHHDEADGIHQKSKGTKDHCCNDEVIKFSQVDKSIPQSSNTGLHPVFFTTFLTSFYALNILITSKVTANNRYFLRSYHPPIPDIRIAVQSFQI